MHLRIAKDAIRIYTLALLAPIVKIATPPVVGWFRIYSRSTG